MERRLENVVLDVLPMCCGSMVYLIEAWWHDPCFSIRRARTNIYPKGGKEEKEMAETQSMTLTRGEVNDLFARFATKNPEYRKALLADPRKVVSAQLGQTIPPSVEIKIIEEKPNEFYLILPYVPQEGQELSDADLEQVAGGALKEVQCNFHGGATLNFGTQVEIKL